ncbi:MAG: threonine/serine dehydratase [Pseudomonadota bacterium]
MNNKSVVSADGVRRAAERLRGVAMRTPLIENQLLNERIGARVLLKAESLQHCGSFKFRGAYTFISRLGAHDLKRGVIAWSSGNHGQAVARAARLFGVKAVIVMPEDAPLTKRQGVERDGATIVTYDRYKDDREAIAREIAEREGYIIAPSFDHPDIIEGQGTTALEAAEGASRQGLSFDAFVVCCGGGGLTAGCATILKDMTPDADILIVEPEGFDETLASIRTGERQAADVSQHTLCDALATPTPGQLTLEIMRNHVSGGAAVSDQETMAAMRFAFQHLRIILEPGGAVALAALLAKKLEFCGDTVCVTLSGGNVDSSLFREVLREK